ncbi:MAG: hypothetical protein KDD00_06535 [Ignavibacteriae bacterium]|nr:hypothetical protein [Ignavibacteriota bacterium]
MKIRKFLVTIFIILSVNFSFQPVTFYIRERQSVVYTIKSDKNKITDDFINKNETKRFYILVSLTFQAEICESEALRFNSS